MGTLFMMGVRICIAAGLALLTAMPAVAVEDAATPGAWRWEIKFGVGGERSTGKWELALPEADVNYGIGEHGQLVLGVQRLQLRERGSASQSGWGRGGAGPQWRVPDIQILR